MHTAELLAQLTQMGSDTNREGMARFGINTEKAWGISVTQLRTVAKSVGKDLELSLTLWQTGFHEARILSFFVLPPKHLTPELMEERMPQFNSWDLCDQACILFASHPDVFRCALAWSHRKPLFEKRAAFSAMAAAAVHQKKAPDQQFLPFLAAIEQNATDNRNYVLKAVNWALRQIGKRSMLLHQAALQTAETISKMDDRTARWIATDALRELNDERVIARVQQKAKRKISKSVK